MLFLSHSLTLTFSDCALLLICVNRTGLRMIMGMSQKIAGVGKYAYVSYDAYLYLCHYPSSSPVALAAGGEGAPLEEPG